MKYDLNILNNYIERGYIVKQDHPNLPLSIYNYSRTCQYEGRWDNITLNCRGLILDNEGNVIARSFPKFFNMEEMDEIPNSPFEVYEKMDGSLGIVFYYNGEWHLASKGSFTSDQAIKGKEMLYTHDVSKLNTHYTYLFEIIYKENRIVLDYDFDDLVLLAIMDTDTGAEPHLDHVNTLDFRVVKQYHSINDYKQLKSMISVDQEGFVVRFKDGTRMKIKGEEYVRLHRIMTGLSNVDIWEILKNGENIEQYLEKVPDEFDKWVRTWITRIQYGRGSIREHCGKIHDYFRYGKYGDREDEPTIKDFALHIQANVKEKPLHSVLYAIWNNKPYEHILWKLVKPKYEKPIWQDNEIQKIKERRPELFKK